MWSKFKSFLEKIDTYTGRKVFKNLSGVSGNLGGRINLYLSRKISGVQSGNAELENGFRKLEYRIPGKKVSSMVEKFDRYIEEGDVTEARVEDENVILRMDSYNYDFQTRLPEALEIIDSIDQEIKNYLGSEYKLDSITLMRYPETKEEKHKSESVRNWHLDPFSTDYLRIFVYLSDTARDSGTIFLDRESTVDILENSRMENIFVDLEDDDLKSEANYLYGEKGTIAFGDPVNRMHRGQGNPENNRDLLVFSVRPSPTGHGPDWKEKKEYDRKKKDGFITLRRSGRELLAEMLGG